MSADELRALADHLEVERQRAVTTLDAPVTLDLAAADSLTLTDDVGVELRRGPPATGGGHATISMTGTGAGYAVPAPPPKVAAALWDDIRPRNSEQAVAYLQVLLPYVRLLLLLLAGVGGAAWTAEQVEDAVRDALTTATSTVEDEAQPSE